ncbi:MAG: T9SS type A sorting domain-containing protein [candidate division WOR-3 bacterium]
MKKYLSLIIFIIIIANWAIAETSSFQYRGDFCGTPSVLEDFRQGKLLPVRPTLSGPELTIDRTNFRVHYTQQGVDAVSTVYAETAASALQYSWTILVDSLGYAPPPPDFNQGGDDRYDIYIMQLSSGIAGVTYPEYGYPNPYPDGVCSHFRIANDLSLNYMKSTVTHEFMHAIEFRYSSVEGTWWMENCAVWAEDIVYDELNDYLGFLSTSPNPLNDPHLSITNGSNLYWYAGGIWPMFLREFYDLDCIRKIWTYQGQIAGQNALSGIDYVLTNDYGSSLTLALKNYSVWRYFTGTRADTIHFFKEGNLFPTSRILQSHLSYPVTGNQGSYPVNNVGGTNFIQFLNGGGKIFIDFNAQSLYRWGCHVVAYKPNGQSNVYELTLNTSGAGSDSFDWQNYDHFALIPVLLQWEWNTGAQGFNYSANIRILHDVGIVSLSGYPVNVDSGQVVTIQALVKNYGQFAENFPVKLTIGNFYEHSQNINLGAGDSIIVTFPPCTMNMRNYQAVLCTTMLATDERPNNNSISDRIFVRVRDVAVLAIIEPQANVAVGSYIHPKARIKNYGNVREIFYIDFYINGWTATQRLSLSAGLEFDLEWDSLWHPTDTGNYLVKCSTKLANDVNHDNDWQTTYCYVYPAAIYETNNILTRTLPSFIIKNRKLIIANIDEHSSIELALFDIQGRLVYSITTNRSLIDLPKQLSTGCYIVKLKVNEQELTKKSVIIN